MQDPYSRLSFALAAFRTYWRAKLSQFFNLLLQPLDSLADDIRFRIIAHR